MAFCKWENLKYMALRAYWLNLRVLFTKTNTHTGRFSCACHGAQDVLMSTTCSKYVYDAHPPSHMVGDIATWSDRFQPLSNSDRSNSDFPGLGCSQYKYPGGPHATWRVTSMPEPIVIEIWQFEFWSLEFRPFGIGQILGGYIFSSRIAPTSRTDERVAVVSVALRTLAVMMETLWRCESY